MKVNRNKRNLYHEILILCLENLNLGIYTKGLGVDKSNYMVYLIQGICFGEYWKNQNCRLAFGKIKLLFNIV